jgi:hypothetical protein
MLAYFTPIENILLPLGIFYGELVYFNPFGTLYREKSGNPAPGIIFSAADLTEETAGFYVCNIRQKFP